MLKWDRAAVKCPILAKCALIREIVSLPLKNPVASGKRSSLWAGLLLQQEP